MQMQLFTHYPAPRARRLDPQTSRDAADLAAQFKQGHYLRITRCMSRTDGKTAGEIGADCGMDNVQVSRRLPELESAGIVCRDAARVCGVKGSKMTTWRLV